MRGSVQQSTEEHTTPPFENYPGGTYSVTTQYDLVGKVLRTATISSYGAGTQEFSTTYSYDSAGRLVKTKSTNPESTDVELLYDYDDRGRLIGISGEPDHNSTFQYDEHGHKARVVTQGPKSGNLPADGLTMFPLPDRADPFLPIPAGGQVKTFFNDTDQPVEWQVVDASGNLLNRLIRSYDAKGRVTEVSYPLENSPMSLPEEDRQQFLAEPGTEEEFAKQLVKLLGAKKEFVRTTYAYDAKGRLAERRCCIGRSMEMVTTTTYNDHSDKLEESSTTFGDPDQPRNEGTGEFPATGSRHYFATISNALSL